MRRSLLLLSVQITLFFIILYRIVPVPITPLVVMRGFPAERDWVSFDRISPNMVKAAITAEDPKFVNHHGFDFEAIRESIEKSIDKGKKAKGRSTISQQTAKNLFFGPARSGRWARACNCALTCWPAAGRAARRVGSACRCPAATRRRRG